MVRRLIIASNRLPVSIREEHGVLSLSRSNGGLATALASLFRQDSSLWVGWTGLRRQLTDAELQRLALPPQLTAVNLTEKEITRYYDGFSNGILWPLAHGLPETVAFTEEIWQNVQKATQRFADAIESVAAPDDDIWIHDYHLLLLPGVLRARGLKNRIGFFLHTPFPTLRAARKVPHLPEILKSLAATDLVGVQTKRDVRRLNLLGRIAGVKAKAFPIGINFAEFNAPTDDKTITKLAAACKKEVEDYSVIFSLSRLDYTKGILTQLEAYRRFLAKWPASGKKTIYRLNVAPSRESMLEYRSLREAIEGAVRTINQQFGTKTWQPVVYSYENMGPEEITAWFRTSDIHLNTPIADGMNLIAKEYVAARKPPGALIISSTMGAASQLAEALIVPPKNPDTIAAAIHAALTMPEGERSRRWTALRHEVEMHQVAQWADDFMKSLSK
jgi:trehalose 6-phosphate synthase/phosphatase